MLSHISSEIAPPREGSQNRAPERDEKGSASS